MKNRFSPTRLLQRLHRDEGGTAPSRSSSAAGVPAIVTIFVQFALILNAKIMVTNAAAAAARSA